ncbi:hypothetical protein FDH86_gp071 [Arthrobacter phage Tank]|uniref:Uncharacterized protein n=2 Tax=Tankvirus tank TaxID=1982567 RepID=A0A0U4B796_9CAUD|nr:hypothetical protein FDH86_gp071 [Arthrobacter phage Tank]ALY10606.1 hypothetical protein TANK_71 [Arthrobacter phage Tank]ALY10856.1 hypothetical protein WILDE_73 [Arthrobacter phage Wilde]
MVTAASKAKADAKPGGTEATPPAADKKSAGLNIKTKGETVQQLKNRLRNEAEREVLNKYKPEVIKRTEAKYDEHGLEYVRRLTDEEKAEKEVADLLAKYPQLRKQFEVAPVEEVEGPDYDSEPVQVEPYAEPADYDRADQAVQFGHAGE